MSILLDERSGVIIQGLTGWRASSDAKYALDYGTRIVAGVVPGKAGQVVHGVPVYHTVASALREYQAQVSVIYVPGPGAKDAAAEAVDAGLTLVVVITEGVPQRDFSEIYTLAKRRGVRLIGPNTNGIISSGKAKVGMIGNAAWIFERGPIGVVSRSGGMSQEISWLLKRHGLGTTTCLSIGGDPMVGSTFREILELFQRDPETRGVVLFGEPGGTAEEDAAEFVRQGGFTKPLVALVSGEFLERMPEGISFGHAGSIVERGRGTRRAKIAAFREAGVPVAETLSEIPELIKARV